MTGEAHYQAAVGLHADLASLVWLAIAGLRGTAEVVRRRRAGDPMRGLAAQRLRQQPGVIVTLFDVQDVARDVLADHEPGCLRTPSDTADVETFTLTKGVVAHTGMLADHAVICSPDLARFAGQVVRQEFAKVALADEADAGGIAFAGPLSLLDAAEAGRPNLDRYNVILLSDGQYSAAWAEKLKTWIANGGTLVAMSGAAQWAIRNNLIDEKMKDVPGINLSKVPYADLARTRGAQDIAGAIFDVQLDPTHPLAFGYGKTVQVFRNSERFFMPSAVPGANVGLYTAKPRVSGYVSDEMLAQIPQTAALLARKSGKGGVVLMADNPNFRAFWYGTNGLMLNAVFFGHNF